MFNLFSHDETISFSTINEICFESYFQQKYVKPNRIQT